MEKQAFNFALFCYNWQFAMFLAFYYRPHIFDWRTSETLETSSEYVYTGALEFGRN